MKKKLGPLQTYQWLMIGAAIGVLYYIHKVRQQTASGPASSTPSQAAASTDLGPIDPTTGAPFALEGAYQQGAASAATGANNANQNAGPTTLAQELGDLGMIETLITGLNQALPLPATDNSANTNAGQAGQAQVTQTMALEPSQFTAIASGLSTADKGIATINKTVTRIQKAVVHRTTKPTSNPGHTVITHNTGKKSASSSAPANKRQQVNVAPPSHQRANPTSHPSAPQPVHKPEIKIAPRQTVPRKRR